jgi:glutamyl-tRNA(Gln) amidotransferase subunit E
MEWNVPEDTHTYLLKNNLVPLLEKAQTELHIPARFTSGLLAHTLKHLQGQYPPLPDFSFDQVFGLLKFLVDRKMDIAIAKRMLFHLYQHPKMDFESILITLNFREVTKEEILEKVPFLVKKYKDIRTSHDDSAGLRWVMGNLNKLATGNISLKELSQKISLNT